MGFPLGPYRFMKLEWVLGFRLYLVILVQIISFSINPFWVWVNENFWGVDVYIKFKKIIQNFEYLLTFFMHMNWF